MEDSVSRSRTLAATTPRVTRAWYVLATSDEVGSSPITRRLYGRPIVLWRTPEGVATAFEDRCPHRAVPLSFGKVVGGTLQCGYHGWRFSADGDCAAIPSLPGDPRHPARRARVVPVREQQGFVWAWADADAPPEGEPFRFPHADDPAYTTVRKTVSAGASVHAVVENALDVPHTSFLHGGLFRTDADRRPIRCEIRRFDDRVECEFFGERAPKGLAARILSPTGGEIRHVDRFRLPSITEVEYHLGDDHHVVLNGACTPVDDLQTQVHAVVSIRTRLPRGLVRRALEPLALRIFRQDAVILALQTKSLQTFPDASFVSTDVDVLGGHVLRLLTRAARGEAGDPSAPPLVRETTMLV